MKRLAFIALIGLLGCQDAQMNLGPEDSTASGGKAKGTNPGVGSTAGQAQGGTGVSGTGVGGGTTGGTVAGGTAAGGAAGSPGTAGTAADPSFHGIDLAGMQRLTFTAQGGMPRNASGVCRGTEPEIYSVDLATKVLGYEHCDTASDGVTAIRAQQSRQLTDSDVATMKSLLERVSTDYEPTCGLDMSSLILELGFGDRSVEYYDDFYSSCPGAANHVYVHGLTGLWSFLEGLRPTSPSLPACKDVGFPKVCEPGPCACDPTVDTSVTCKGYVYDFVTVSCQCVAAYSVFAPAVAYPSWFCQL